jgi:peptidoglycan/LPS O-acetylase OafA/YrhL
VNTVPARNAGLDLVRAIAVLLVVVFHTPMGQSLEIAGLLSVEIFFVLSGFLVTQMLIERFDGARTPAACAAFVANRALRTVPLYYLALCAHIALAASYTTLNPMGAPGIGNFADLPDLLPFFTLTQNLTDGGISRHGNWFGISWSLAIEEAFYLMLPLLLLLRRKHRLVATLVGASVAVIVACLLGRALRHMSDPTLAFDDHYRRVLLLRFDALSVGLLSYLAIRRYGDALARYRALLAAAGLALLALSQASVAQGIGGDAYLKIAHLTVIAISTALALPFFLHLRIPGSVLTQALRFVSTRTYAIYLIHLPIAHFWMVWGGPVDAIGLSILLAIVLVAADGVYRCIERPLMRWRPRASVVPGRTAAADRLHYA